MDDLHDRPRGLPGRRRPGPRGAPPGADATELLGRIVPDRVAALAPSSGWRIYTIGSSLPGLDPATYRLEIAGAVERPVTYTLADLRGLPRATQVSDFHCVTGRSVDDVRWACPRRQALAARCAGAAGPVQRGADLLTLGSVGLLVGHLYLAVIHPTTRHSLRGMTLGDVREDWAHAHHPKWVEQERSLRDGL
jgi:hypothetical protein